MRYLILIGLLGATGCYRQAGISSDDDSASEHTAPSETGGGTGVDSDNKEEVSDGEDTASETDTVVSLETDSAVPVCGLPAPGACAPTWTLEAIDITAMVGETVVQEVEVLDDGAVLVAGYFGLLRREPEATQWDRYDVPDVVSSGFLQLTHEGADNVFATALSGVVHSTDGGRSWSELPTFEGASCVYPGSEFGVLLGGESSIGVYDASEDAVDWYDIPVLEEDGPNNSVLSIVFDGTRLLAADYFGRIAWSAAPWEPWQTETENIHYGTELLDVGDGRILTLSEYGTVTMVCDGGQTWRELGEAEKFPSVSKRSTQMVYVGGNVVVAAGSEGPQVSCDLGQTWTTIPPGTDPDTTYDVSLDPDGTVWVTGFNHVFHIELNP